MTSWTLVTGGAKGLGATICKTLAAKGHSIIVHYRQSNLAAQQVVAACRELGVEADCCQGDFSSPEFLQDFINRYESQFGEVGSLINNVGGFLTGSVIATPSHLWRELFETNLHAPVALIQAFLTGIKRAEGSIVNFGVAGVEHAYADVYSSAYSASKAALWQVTRSLAREMAPSNVRVNMVSPGYLETSVVKSKTLPMGRDATLQETADLVAYLLSDSARYITGQNIEVGGGIRL